MGVDERIWLKARINGKRARLCFDSGSSAPVLTAEAVSHLGLKVIHAPTNDFGNEMLAGVTEEATVTLEGTKWNTHFMLLSFPGYVRPDFDGLLGWFSISHNVVEIDAAATEVSFLENVPKRTAQWARFAVITNFSTLDLEIPHRADREGGVVCIDTGDSGGLLLPPDSWIRWKQMHPQVPFTLVAAFDGLDGFMVYEEAWADEISVGPVVLRGLPVGCSGSGNQRRFGTRYEGTLGLSALKRLNLIVDGHSGVAYLQAKTSRPPACDHNRLGAVFVPTATRPNQAVAYVVEHGPAYDAGVRNGDVLLRVDDVAVTSWSNSWLSRFHLPSGTRLKLKLLRDERDFETTAILRDIVKPAAGQKISH